MRHNNTRAKQQTLIIMCVCFFLYKKSHLCLHSKIAFFSGNKDEEFDSLSVCYFSNSRYLSYFSKTKHVQHRLESIQEAHFGTFQSRSFIVLLFRVSYGVVLGFLEFALSLDFRLASNFVRHVSIYSNKNMSIIFF